MSSSKTEPAEVAEAVGGPDTAPVKEVVVTDYRVTYRRLLQYALPHWRVFLVAIVCLVGMGATNTSFAALMKPLIDGSFVDRDPKIISLIPFAIMGLALIRLVVDFGSKYAMAWIARKVIRQLRTEMFDHLLRLPAGFFDRQASGKLMSKVTYDVEQVATAATEAVSVLTRESITVIGLLGWMVYLNWKLAVGFVVVGPTIALVILKLNRRYRGLSKRLQESMGEITQATDEIITGQLITKIFNSQPRESAAFEKISDSNRNLHMKWISVDTIGSNLVQIILAVALAGSVYAAATFASTDQMTAGGFMSFIMAMMMLQGPIKKLTKMNSLVQRGLTAAISVFGLLDQFPEEDEGSEQFSEPPGTVAFENVSFAYGSEDRSVLRSISFEVESGQTVAIVGRSGGGKSTLVSLLPRFYNPQQGVIRVGGIDHRLVSLQALREQISLVGQSVILFNDTVANNIAYGGGPDVTAEQIEAAARMANAWEFISQLPDGLDSLVGDNGVLLSGGQRQRIAIARALLKDAPILILDEATSSLDTESERAIQAALEGLMANRTTLVIAHRLSTIENADLILVVRDGEIAERGTHAELIQKQGFYAELHRMQFNEPKLAV
ncbi:MAG: lipid A export permease/ATP-binding protein MsbA [Gammaproteobacteria bacterium]